MLSFPLSCPMRPSKQASLSSLVLLTLDPLPVLAVGTCHGDVIKLRVKSDKSVSTGCLPCCYRMKTISSSLSWTTPSCHFHSLAICHFPLKCQHDNYRLSSSRNHMHRLSSSRNHMQVYVMHACLLSRQRNLCRFPPRTNLVGMHACCAAPLGNR